MSRIAYVRIVVDWEHVEVMLGPKASWKIFVRNEGTPYLLLLYKI
jgi:hypothetical protein